MKKTLVASAIAMSFAVFPAVAEENFTGFSAGLGAAVSGGEAKITQDKGNKLDASLGKRSIIGVIDLGYAYQFDPLWGIGAGATYDINKSKFGEIGTTKVEGKTHYSVYLQPFVAVTPTTAIFAKIGYHSIKGTYKTDAGDSSKGMKGIGYGFGVKTIFADNFYAQAEAGVVDYGKKTLDDASATNLRMKSTTGMISVGYKF